MVNFSTFKETLKYNVHLSEYYWADCKDVISISDGNCFIQVSPFYGFCGGNCFFNAKGYSDNTKVFPSFFKEILKICKLDNNNLATYLTNKYQIKLQEVLSEIGFTPIFNFVNSNSGTPCTLWTINLEKVNLDV